MKIIKSSVILKKQNLGGIKYMKHKKDIKNKQKKVQKEREKEKIQRKKEPKRQKDIAEKIPKSYREKG
jgi:hypothetical protein